MIKLIKEQESAVATLLKIDLGTSQASSKELAEELADLEFPEITGSKGLIISGFPQFAALTVACEYKNKCTWISIVDPKVTESLSAVVVFSLSHEYLRGDIVSLEDCGLNS